MKKLKFLLAVNWRPVGAYALGLIFILTVLFARLGSLTPSFSQAELSTVQSLQSRDLSLSKILESPVHLPYNFGVYIYSKLGLDGLFFARSISAIVGLITAASFFYVVQRWHGRRIAIMALVLFGTSSWFLHTARLATPEVFSSLLLLLIVSGIWLQKTQHHNFAVLTFTLISSLMLLYVPGMIWFLMLGVIWQQKRIKKTFLALKASQSTLLIATSLILILPLVLAIVRQPRMVLEILNLPSSVPAIGDVLRNAGNVLGQLFIHGPADPERWIGAMPLLDAFSLAMFVVGAYSCIRYIRLDRTKLLIAGLIVGFLLVTIGELNDITILMPFVYLLVATGMGYMLQQWFNVFPRNPLARGLGVGLISIAVLASASYNLTHYFVAWAKAPETKSSFSRHL